MKITGLEFRHYTYSHDSKKRYTITRETQPVESYDASCYAILCVFHRNYAYVIHRTDRSTSKTYQGLKHTKLRSLHVVEHWHGMANC